MFSLLRKILVYITVLLLVCTSSCSKSRGKAQPSSPGYSYSCVFFDVPEKENYEVYQTKVLMSDSSYRIAVGYLKINESVDGLNEVTDIYSVDEDGDITYTLEMQGLQIPQGIFGDSYVYVGYMQEDIDAWHNGQITYEEMKPTAVFFNQKSGEVEAYLKPDFQATCYAPLNDGFVLLGSAKIAQYDHNRQLVRTIDMKTPEYGELMFFEQNQHYYVHEMVGGRTTYYEVKFDIGTTQRIVGEQEISAMGLFYGQYVFDNHGEYRIDFSNLQTKTLAKFSDMDFRPPKKTCVHREYIPLNDTHFVREYMYADGTAELLLFTYDPSIDYSKSENIVIGGYNISASDALKWAVYNFNTSQNDYRAVLVDYSEQFGFDDPKDAQKQRLALMKYFQEGHAPDMFFGYYFFDYEYMGKSGMVLDMRPYIENDDVFSFSEFSPSVEKMLNQKDHIYQLFAGYSLNGLIGIHDIWTDDTDVSIFDLYDMAQSKNAIAYYSTAEEIVIEALGYNFKELWSEYRNRPEQLHEEIHRLLEIAYEIGGEDVLGVSYDELQNEKVLLTPLMITGLRAYEMQVDGSECSLDFVGYPSLSGAVHLINPNDLVAISASGKHPDICWSIIREMFTEEAQEQVAISGTIPVHDKVLQNQCEEAANQKETNPHIVDDFLRMAYSADTIVTYDWGVTDIIRDEVSSYYTQNRSIDQITNTLIERLNLYYEENYQ